jgi:hypothetical protein
MNNQEVTMKWSLVLVTLLLTMWGLYGQTTVADSSEVHLKLTNIELLDVTFHRGNEVRVVNKTDNEIDMHWDEQFLVISAPSQTPVELHLPKDKTYYYRHKKMFCMFTRDACSIVTPNESVVSNSDGLVFEETNGQTKVVINAEGIFVRENNEFVAITSDGIHIKEGSDEKDFDGIFGFLVGGLVRGTVATTLWCMGNVNDNLVVAAVNDQFDECTKNKFKLELNY